MEAILKRITAVLLMCMLLACSEQPGTVRLLWPSLVIRYEGGFEDGKYQGFGLLYRENGKIAYEGEYRDDSMLPSE
ncbi:MAG: hypothetical protein F9K24_12160 [Leptonema illini]|uniref:Uncharacterized protein n=1 Tax=Leptonema illini TaxID=183 RepID=A0A833LX26_9LEPT|nr:MAG: hypothetical protein F9K24_12160 [Leptonema illini]